MAASMLIVLTVGRVRVGLTNFSSATVCQDTTVTHIRNYNYALVFTKM